MKRVKVLFINLIALTATSLLMRTIGISFQVYLSNKIGSSGIGLFQLIMSVYYLAITFSISGIRLAAMRLVAEEIGMGRNYGTKKAVHNCFIYSVFFSLVFAALLFFGSNYIGTKWLCDIRTVLSLRILAFSLPFIAMSSVFNGYFTAVRRAVKAASVQLFEQIIKISVTIACLSFFIPWGLQYACAGIVIGTTTGEICSFLLLYSLFHYDIKRYKKGSKATDSILYRMLKIALPVAFTAYITSSIRTLQQLLIPVGFKKSGSSSEAALSTYGIIQGMVMPVIMFPSVLLDVISDLIVPELAECKACGSNKRLNYIVSRVFNFGLLSSICVMSIFLRFSNELGMAIYKSKDAAFFIRVLAPIIPIMYLDTVVDSMLKGLGEQLKTMRYNIIECLIGVALIYTLLPRFAITGYIFTIFFTRVLNFSLSINRLIKITDLKISIFSILKYALCIAGSLNLSTLFFNIFNLSIIPLPIHITFVIVIYFLLLRMLSCITHDDLLWFRSIFK